MVQAAVVGGLPRTYVLLVSAALAFVVGCAGRGDAFMVDAGPPETGPEVPTLPFVCRNGNKDLGETDLDCGGGVCPPCQLGQGCATDVDCERGTCSLTSGSGKCTATAACSNTRRDSDETDVDCGGDDCAGCAANRRCMADADCASGMCVSESCM
jgi:hypothetical protein